MHQIHRNAVVRPTAKAPEREELELWLDTWNILLNIITQDWIGRDDNSLNVAEGVGTTITSRKGTTPVVAFRKHQHLFGSIFTTTVEHCSELCQGPMGRPSLCRSAGRRRGSKAPGNYSTKGHIPVLGFLTLLCSRVLYYSRI